jgi:hypothetical protein
MALHTPLNISLDDPASREFKHTPVSENSRSAMCTLLWPGPIPREDLDGRIAL